MPDGVPYEVRSSALHGRGLFATRAIRKGQLIGEAEGVRTRRDGPHVLWLIDDDGGEEGWRLTNAMRYVNHDTPANAHFEGLDLVAVADIPEGAEITFDYGTLLEEEVAFDDGGRSSEEATRDDELSAGALE
ncbi:MAG: SET domain-containing protein [Planctomycetes bacterium]|nr:SET domain-containing protein [Planctomycetota bacterium]